MISHTSHIWTIIQFLYTVIGVMTSVVSLLVHSVSSPPFGHIQGHLHCSLLLHLYFNHRSIALVAYVAAVSMGGSREMKQALST